jgi:hypothetical protein
MTEPSHAVMVTHWRSGRETEKTVIEANGVAGMVNEDGSITIDLFRDKERGTLRIRINKEDAAANSSIFKRWGKQ